MTEYQNTALYISDQCRRAGMTLAGCAGVLINLDCESGISETNVEDRYHRDTGRTDADYTRMVDENPAYDFETDNGMHYGYGIAQWTLASRKKWMREFHAERGVSIGDFRTQVDFMLAEFQRDFPSVWNILCTSNDASVCAWHVCRWYENPANAEKQANYRAGEAHRWYEFLIEHSGEESTIPDQPEKPETDDDGIVIEKTWPPRTLQRGRCSGWKEIKLLEAALSCHGYNVLTDGMFEEALEEKIIAFQKKAFPNQPQEWDGKAGPKTWKELLKL